MADDDQGSLSPKNDQAQAETKEDDETRAARRELKQSTLSDRDPSAATGVPSSEAQAARPDTPVTADGPDLQSDDLKEQVASPKKKRAHDQLDVESEQVDEDARSIASTDSARDRASRLEPEKKRHRDGELSEEKPKAQPTDSQTATKPTTDTDKSTDKKESQTSNSAFAASSFGKLAGGSSPFATLGGTSKGSIFGSSGNASTSSFASVPPSSGTKPTAPTTTTAAPPKLIFGGSGGGLSPFAGLSSGSNGMSGGSSFGSALGSSRPLQSFAAPGVRSRQSEKPAKPFGAPESDVESDNEEEDEGSSKSSPAEADRGASPEKETEEKRRTRLQKVEVNDGEAGEATVISVRAKMFHLEKVDGWKERGAGMLKINVPQSCVEFDDSGVPIPGTFDASGLEDGENDCEAGSEGPKICRLIMRQDQTHRIILNTAIVPAMEFQEKASLKSVGILFTAFEGEDAKPVSITMRMTAANSKTFMNEIDAIQRELRGH